MVVAPEDASMYGPARRPAITDESPRREFTRPPDRRRAPVRGRAVGHVRNAGQVHPAHGGMHP